MIGLSTALQPTKTAGSDQQSANSATYKFQSIVILDKNQIIQTKFYSLFPLHNSPQTSDVNPAVIMREAAQYTPRQAARAQSVVGYCIYMVVIEV